MAARSAAIRDVGLVLPRRATIRPNLDHLRCDLSYLSMSFLDSSDIDVGKSRLHSLTPMLGMQANFLKGLRKPL
jgi:hypothetical protein